MLFNNSVDPFAENDAASSSSTRTLSVKSTGKRTARRTLQASNKKRSGITMARDEYGGVEGGPEIDETAVGGFMATKSMGSSSVDKTVADINDEDEDEDEDEDDGGGEETIEDLIQRSQVLEDESNSTEKKREGVEKIPSSRNLTLEDLPPQHRPSSTVDDDGYCPGTTPPIYSPQHLLGSDLPSTDPADMNFVDQEDLNQSTSRLYSWNFLDGSGRLDSDVDSNWVHNEIDIGGDLMACRNRIVENNGGLTEPFEKLAVNFVFLVEAEYQTGGLQGEVEDLIWDSLCDAVRDFVLPLSNEDVAEAHQWAHRLAQNKSETFAKLLDESPPLNRTLKSIMTKMADTAQL
ncbi:hypothetical protein BGZ54_008831 [Gamsiella multidivaricata]|nr:hypothetical protein BGZ54_008831 [Gamsiella multidivaricata]